MSLEHNLEIKFVELRDIKPNPKNNNKHSKAQIERLAKIVNYQGFRQPIVVSNQSGFIVTGHARLSAAKKLGLKKAPVSYQDFDGPEQEYAHMTADNEIARWAEIDMDSLKMETKSWDIDPDFFGLPEFKIEEEKEGLDYSDSEKDDQVPEAEDNELGVELGDIYKLGDHRLMCGDSTCGDTVAKLMNGEKADMVFTDPPYGISYSSDKFTGNMNEKKSGSKIGSMILNDDLIIDLDFLFKIEDIPVWVWGANNFSGEFLIKKGVWHCWDKRSNGPDSIGNADGLIGSQFELVWTNAKSGYQKMFRIMHCGAINKDGGKRVHPTQKPTHLCIESMEHCKIKVGALVLDYFLGSGSTLIACEKTNRKCFGMELDPHYCSVIIKRWEEYTGQKAVKL